MQVLFFAQLKDATRCESIVLTVAAPMTSEQLWVELLRRFPALTAYRPGVRLAKNQEYAGKDATFADGDEVALIPPVSGG